MRNLIHLALLAALAPACAGQLAPHKLKLQPIGVQQIQVSQISATTIGAGATGIYSPSSGPNAGKPVWRNIDTSDTPMTGGGSVQLDVADWAFNRPYYQTFGGSISYASPYFYALKASTAVGVHTHWCGGATTLKASLWNFNTMARLASGTLAVAGAGNVTVNFSSSFSMVPGVQYIVTIWDMSGTNYCATINTSADVVNNWPGYTPSGEMSAFSDNINLEYQSLGRYGTGDAFPSNPGSNAIYGASLVYTVP
jgi:hypothetical protein